MLPFAEKLFVSYKELDGIPKKYVHKIYEIGNIVRQEIINSDLYKVNSNFNEINVLVLGGSQAAKIFADELPQVLKAKGANFQ